MLPTKVRVTFKDPDGPADCIAEAVRSEVEKLGLDAEEFDAVYERRLNSVKNVLSKWLPWGEYVTIEFDIEAGTATVIPCK